MKPVESGDDEHGAGARAICDPTHAMRLLEWATRGFRDGGKQIPFGDDNQDGLVRWRCGCFGGWLGAAENVGQAYGDDVVPEAQAAVVVGRKGGVAVEGDIE